MSLVLHFTCPRSHQSHPVSRGGSQTSSLNESGVQVTAFVCRAAITKYDRLGGSDNRIALSHSSGGQASKIQVSAVSMPLGCGRGSVLCLPPSFQWAVAIFADARLVDASPGSLPLSSHGILPVCPTSPFIRTPVILDQGPTLPQYDLSLANYCVAQKFIWFFSI